MRPCFRLASLALLSLALAGVTSAQRPELVIQTGHSDHVGVIAFAPDGRLLASGGSDNTVRLWDTTTGAELRVLKGHARAVLSLAFARDGRVLASGGADQTIKLWDAGDGRELRVLGDAEAGAASVGGGVASLAFGADGRTLVGVVLSMTPRGTGLSYALSFRHWDYTTGQLLSSSDAPCGQVIAAALSPDGRTLASGGYAEPLTLWDAETGRKLRVFEGGDKVIEAVSFSPDGRTVAGAGRLWDAATGRELRALGGYEGGAFSPDGRTLAVIEGRTRVSLLAVATGEAVRTFDGPQLGIDCLAFSPDGTRLASGDGDFVIRLRGVATGSDEGALRGHGGAVNAVAFTGDGRTLVTGHVFTLFRRDTIRLWDTKTGRQPRSLAGPYHSPTGIALSGDGRTLVAGEAGRNIYVWDLAAGGEARKLNVGLTPDAVALSADGQTLACGGRDKTIKIFNAATDAERRTMTGTLASTYSLAITRDGRTLARGGPQPFIELWDAARGQQLNTLTGHAANVNALAFSPDGRLLASGSRDKTVMLWDVATGQLTRTLGGHTGVVYSVAFSPDGRVLASGGEDKTVRLWDVASGRELLTLKGHTGSVLSVAFRGDGHVLASGGADTTVRLWSLPEGRELASLLALDEQDWLVVTPDGLFDGSPPGWNQILWRFSPTLNDIYPVEYFFNEFYYPDLLTDIFAGRRPAARRDIAQKDRRPPHLKLSSAGVAGGATPAREVKLTIDVSNAPAGARDVRLFRNGSLVRVWRGDVLKGQQGATLEATAAVVAGENRFAAYAFNNENIKSADAVLTITGADSLKRKGTAYIVAAGVNEYAPNPFFQNLKYAVADADDFAAEVAGQQERLAQFERVEVVKLTDERATKANILGALAELAKKAQPEDEVVVYFAGHGLAEGGSFYLIPHDIGAGAPADITDQQAALDRMLAARAVSDAELEAAFEGVGAGRLTLIIDACNSGQALGGEREGRGPMNSKGLAQLAYDKGMYILTAAQSFQAAQEAPQVGHGLLTYALVEEGLKQAGADDEPKDGRVLAREWLDYAANRVPEMQVAKMKAARSRGINLSFKEEERGLDIDQRSGQRPRVFYRRELEAQPFVIARPGP